MKTKIAIFTAAFVLLGGCTSVNSPDYLSQTPKYDLQAFFTGPIKAWGLVQDGNGKVIGRFDARMVGHWQGDTGTLEEVFTYYEGSVQSPVHRTWHFKKLAGGHYQATADDVVGQAEATTYGSAGNLRYAAELPFGGGNGKIKVNFDDWIWQMRDGVVMNRTYLRKFGFKVAEVTVFMQKHTTGGQ